MGTQGWWFLTPRHDWVSLMDKWWKSVASPLICGFALPIGAAKRISDGAGNRAARAREGGLRWILRWLDGGKPGAASKPDLSVCTNLCDPCVPERALESHRKFNTTGV